MRAAAGCASMYRAERGFTLLEVLLALALSASLLTLLSAGMYAVTQDWKRQQDVLADALDRSLVMLQLERALQGALPHSYRDPDTLAPAIFFRGEADSLSWVSTLSPQRQPGLTAWRLSQRPGEGVLLQLAPALSDNPELRLELAEQRLLLPDYQLAVRYLYEDLDGRRLWRQDWDGDLALALPLAVHLQLEPVSRSAARQRAEDLGLSPVLEVVAPVAAWQHRSISPNQAAWQ